MNVRASAAELLQCAKSAYEAGNTEQGNRFYGFILDQLKRFCSENEPHLAIGCEMLIYRILVKFRETDESSEGYFKDWRDDLYQLGLKYRDETQFSAGNGFGFVMQTLYRLGHTEALYQTLKIGGGRPLYLLGSYNAGEKAKFEAIGCKVVSAIDAVGQKASFVHRLSWLRDRMREDEVGTAVWLSTPSAASFTFGMGLARKQVFWSHRHHMFIPGADLYLCYGESGTRNYFGHEWACVRPPMVDWDEVQKMERTSPQFSFGTIAREEKMEYPEFLDAVIEILSRSGSTYDFCGKQLPYKMKERLEKAKVWERCNFSGWVDPFSHISKYRVFLETFPVGGICSLYACAKDVPVVVMTSNTNPLTHMGYLTSANAQIYVDDALRALENPTPRVEMGKAVIEMEKQRGKEDVKRIYEILQ